MRLSQYFLPLLARKPERGADRLAPSDAARRHDPAIERRDLFLAAARPARSEAGRADRPRGAGPLRGAGNPDADDPAGRAVARERPLRRLRQGDAAHPRPARPRDAVRADQRGAGHRDRPRRDQELPRPAEEPLSHPVEVPRRGAPALWRDARPRIPDEGQLQLRPRSGRRPALLQQDVRRLSAHLRADGAEGDPDARRYRPDRRRSEPRIPDPRRYRRERGLCRSGFPGPEFRKSRCRLRRRAVCPDNSGLFYVALCGD